MNPRYSLRAFADFIGLSPSKLSEIFSGKKGLSLDRAEEVSQRLKLKGREKAIFMLSVQVQHSRVKKVRDEAKTRLSELVRTISADKARTKQRNAWYFGACKAIKEAGLETSKMQDALSLTPLQVENAERFVSRIKKLHPDKERFSYETASLFKKISEAIALEEGGALEAEFIFLTKEQADELVGVLYQKILAFVKETKREDKDNLYLFFTGYSELCNKEDLC